MVFSFSIFDAKYTFGSNLIQKNQNCQFKLKFGTQANSHIQNLMKNSMLTFPVSDQKYPFQANSVQKKELSVQAEIWYLDYFEQAEFNAVVFFFCFRSEKLILGKFDTKNQNFQLMLNFCTFTNSKCPEFIGGGRLFSF